MRPSALVVWPGLFLSLVWALPPQPGRTELCSYHSGNKPFFRLPAHNNHGQGGRSANKADFVDCRGVALLEPFHSSAYSRPQHCSRCRWVPLPLPGAGAVAGAGASAAPGASCRVLFCHFCTLPATGARAAANAGAGAGAGAGGAGASAIVVAAVAVCACAGGILCFTSKAFIALRCASMKA